MSHRPTSPPAVGGARVLDCLQELLARQLELVRQGDLIAAAQLAEETGRQVQAVVEARAHEAPGTAAQRQRLEHLYGDLCLALKAQRAETSAALNELRRGLRVLNAYSRTGRFRR
ncbi:MAG: hypothetical protein MUC88_17365 [Planctomycetes bacterium]|jgi:hypothetical protein|nr:hypothetical protein [Planctomycetota bacterium]